MSRGNEDIDQIRDAVKLGGGTKLATSDGSFTDGNVPKFTTDGTLIDSGVTPGGGGGSGSPGSGGGGGSAFATFTVPALSQFTGSASATVADTTTGITVTGSNNQSAAYIRTAGLTPTWNIELGFLAILGPENFTTVGLQMRAGAAGAYIQFIVQHNSGAGTGLIFNIQRLNSSGVFVASVVTKNLYEMMAQQGAIYLGAQTDATNRKYLISPDALIWIPFYSEPRTTHALVDRGGLTISGSTNWAPCGRFIHYKEY